MVIACKPLGGLIGSAGGCGAREWVSLGLLLTVFTTGCSDDANDELLAPPPDGGGIQLTMTTTIGPGVETEHCKFVTTPAEGLYINRDEVRYTEGSHHFLLYLTPYETVPTTTIRGETVDTSGVFDCSEGPNADWEITKLIGGSQNATGESVVSFPSNVGMYIAPNSVLLMDAHYINTSGEMVEPEVRVNLHTVPEEQVEIEGDVLFWYNIFIDVPGQSTARARMRCPIEGDITITNLQSHMHARGVGYAAALMDGETVAAPFYENTAWEGVPVKSFDGGLEVKAGTAIDYYCDYDNPASEGLAQGPRTSDEMCMMIGSYYPASAHTSLCSGDASKPQATNYMGADWVGSGTASCAESMECIQSSVTGGGDFIEGIGKCVNAADPAVSKPYSDAVRCLLMSFVNGENHSVACKEQYDSCGTQ